MSQQNKAIAPAVPRPRLSLAVTGHRAAHPLMSANAGAVTGALAAVLDLLAGFAEAEIGADGAGRTRLHTLLADGADQIAAHDALARGWSVVAPLPLGLDLYAALHAQPATAQEHAAIVAGGLPGDAAARGRVEALRDLAARAHLFELRDADPAIDALAAAAIGGGPAKAALDARISARVALAARVMIEQSDILVAVWDGVRTRLPGGASDTIEAALDLGAAVIHIPPDRPEAWRLLLSPEDLVAPRAALSEAAARARLAQIVRDALQPKAARRHKHAHGATAYRDLDALAATQWRPRSSPMWHAYRRIEALFGGEKGASPFRPLTQVYDTPETWAQRDGAQVLGALTTAPGGDAAFAGRVRELIAPRFVWADAIAARLSDTYRGGMMINFVLSAIAVIGGVAYLPLTDSTGKWAFALVELVMLSAIVLITFLGQKRRWHGRWFETRRVAEYLRHAPILLALGAARAPGRWPRGVETSWPEWYAQQALREAGLPRVAVTPAYLRHCLRELLDRHVVRQRDYHHAKAQRLTTVHHKLDHLSERLFQAAVATVAVFLGLQVGEWLGVVDHAMLKTSAKIFTFLGVALPTLGGAIAGIRYFGDFERFAAISEVTAQKLDAVHARMSRLLDDDDDLDYATVTALAHAADEIVVSEIENWQAVFGGKQITVPV